MFARELLGWTLILRERAARGGWWVGRPSTTAVGRGASPGVAIVPRKRRGWFRTVQVSLALASILLVAGCTGGTARDASVFRQLGGAVSAVGASGDVAWIGTGRRIQSVDVSDPANAIGIGQSAALGEAIRAIAVREDGYVFAAAGTAGLVVLDGRDPKNPELVSRISTRWAVNDVALQGARVYVAEGAQGLRILDASDPAKLEELGRVDTPGDALGVTVRDGVAFVADWGTGVRVMDVTPEHESAAEFAWFDTEGEAADVALAGDVLVVADRAGGVSFVDVSSPFQPRTLTSMDVGGVAERVAATADGGTVFVAAQEGGLVVIDLSSPESPRKVDGLPGIAVAMDVSVVDDRIFVADIGTPVPSGRDSRMDLWSRMHIWGVEGQPRSATGLAGLHIAALGGAERTGPIERLGLHLSPSLIEGLDVNTEADVMYLSDGQAGVLVLDVSTPGEPEMLGSLDTPGLAHDVRIVDDMALIADGPAGLYVLDVTDPRDPRFAAHVDTPDEALGVATYEGYVYVADGESGLRVIDIEAEAEVGFADTPGMAWDVMIHEGYAYVSDRPGGLRIFDLSNPRSPREVNALLQGTGEVMDVVIRGELAYVAAGISGMHIFNIADPEDPQPLGQVLVEERAVGIALEGDSAYVAASIAGLRLIDIADPTAPTEVAFWELAGVAERLIRHDGWVYVAAEMGGLQMVGAE